MISILPISIVGPKGQIATGAASESRNLARVFHIFTFQPLETACGVDNRGYSSMMGDAFGPPISLASGKLERARPYRPDRTANAMEIAR